jgi:hypothetical protein
MFVAEIKEWLGQRAEEKQPLYERYIKPLEETHSGEYVAVDSEGKIILGDRSGVVLRKAVDTFGKGNFSLFRVGHHAFAQWLNLNA